MGTGVHGKLPAEEGNLIKLHSALKRSAPALPTQAKRPFFLYSKPMLYVPATQRYPFHQDDDDALVTEYKPEEQRAAQQWNRHRRLSAAMKGRTLYARGYGQSGRKRRPSDAFPQSEAPGEFVHELQKSFGKLSERSPPEERKRKNRAAERSMFDYICENVPVSGQCQPFCQADGPMRIRKNAGILRRQQRNMFAVRDKKDSPSPYSGGGNPFEEVEDAGRRKDEANKRAQQEKDPAWDRLLPIKAVSKRLLTLTKISALNPFNDKKRGKDSQ